MSGFGLIDILLLAAAIGLAMLLRSNLGRNPARRPPVAAGMTQAPTQREAARAPDAASITPAAQAALAAIAGAEAGFSPASFLEGAEKAYGMVLTGFARGQQAVLATLLDPPVLASFASAIAQRENAGEKEEIKKLRVSGADITDAALTEAANEARITVRFRARQIAWREDAEGRVLAGHPGMWRDIVDVWQFRRQLGADDPTWRVSCTSSEAPPAPAASV